MDDCNEHISMDDESEVIAPEVWISNEDPRGQSRSLGKSQLGPRDEALLWLSALRDGLAAGSPSPGTRCIRIVIFDRAAFAFLIAKKT